MKSKIWKVLAVSIAAAMISCVGAGCANNGNNGQESSKTSVTSSQDESNAESKEESTKESKTESAGESKTESAGESKTESAEDSNTESSVESKNEESSASSEDEPKYVNGWSEEYADTTLGDAVDLCASKMGSGWYFIHSQKSSYEGVDAWAITLNNPELDKTVVGYVNGKDCYFGSSSGDQSDAESAPEYINDWDEEYADTTRAAAVDLAVTRAGGEGWYLTSIEKGKYEGVNAWIISLVNKETETGRIAFVNGSDCYFGGFSGSSEESKEESESSASWEDEYANTTRKDAVDLVFSRMGSGWALISTEKGTYSGEEAWIISIRNEEGTGRLAFVSGSDCYFGGFSSVEEQ